MKEHQIHEKIELLESTISEDELRESIDATDLIFFVTAIRFIRDRLQNALPILISETELNSAANEINASVSNLNTFKGGNNLGHVTNAKNQLVAALNRIKNLPMPLPGGGFDYVTAISDFTEIVAQKNKEVSEQIGGLKSELVQLDSLLEERETELISLKQKIENKSEELENLSQDFESRFATIRTVHDEIFEAQKTEVSNKTEALVNHISQKKDEASKIVNVIANIGITGNYQKIANDHRKAANLWRWGAVILMVGLSGIVVWTVLSTGKGDFDWVRSLIRILAAAALSYPASYAARESSKHRRLENYNRNLELELASIESFIELLPDEKKQNIKEKLAEKYFGSTSLIDGEGNQNNEQVAFGTVERIIDMVKELKN